MMLDMSLILKLIDEFNGWRTSKYGKDVIAITFFNDGWATNCNS
jgi:hypothetical protein